MPRSKRAQSQQHGAAATAQRQNYKNKGDKASKHRGSKPNVCVLGRNEEEEGFFELLLKLQVFTRFDDQRSSGPRLGGNLMSRDSCSQHPILEQNQKGADSGPLAGPRRKRRSRPSISDGAYEMTRQSSGDSCVTVGPGLVEKARRDNRDQQTRFEARRQLSPGSSDSTIHGLMASSTMRSHYSTGTDTSTLSDDTDVSFHDTEHSRDLTSNSKHQHHLYQRADTISSDLEACQTAGQPDQGGHEMIQPNDSSQPHHDLSSDQTFMRPRAATGILPHSKRDGGRRSAGEAEDHPSRNLGACPKIPSPRSSAVAPVYDEEMDERRSCSSLSASPKPPPRPSLHRKKHRKSVTDDNDEVQDEGVNPYMVPVINNHRPRARPVSTFYHNDDHIRAQRALSNAQALASKRPSIVSATHWHDAVARHKALGIDLTSCPWFVGKLARHRAEDLIESQATGTFMVRLGQSGAVMTLKFPVSHDKHCFHLKVGYNAMSQMYSVSDTESFRTIPELVEYYCANSARFFKALSPEEREKHQLLPFRNNGILLDDGDDSMDGSEA